MSYTKLLDKILWWLVTLLLFSFYAMGGDPRGKYLQLGTTAVLGCFVILRYGKKLNFHIAPFHIYMLLFLSFCAVSYSWAILPIPCLHWVFLIGQTLLCLSVVYIYADHQDSTLPLLDSIRWAGYLLTIYLFCTYGWSNLHYMLQESIRLDSDLLNSNTVGMLCAFSIILTLYRVLFVKFSLSYIFVIPTFILFAVSNSRKAFFILVMGISAVVAIKYMKRNLIVNIISGIFIVGLGFLLFYALLSLPMLEGMKMRLMGILGLFSSSYDMDLSTYQRSLMIKIGFEQFLRTPFLGIGIGSSGILTEPVVGWPCYLHNNYVELLSCGGIVGTTLYYLLYIIPGIQLFKYKYCPDKNTLICLILLVLLLLMEWAFVSYNSKEIYFFILVFFLQVKLNKRHFGGNADAHNSKNN